MTLLHHHDDLGTARFVTFSTYQRVKYLEDERLCKALADELMFMRTMFGVKLLGYVFMPDHVHLVLHPPDGFKLGVTLGQAKGRSSLTYRRLVDSNGTTPVWQKRCYDHNCRSLLATKEKIEYCHKNPVTKGLVSEPAEWRWSSYRWYRGLSDAPIQIDGIGAV